MRTGEMPSFTPSFTDQALDKSSFDVYREASVSYSWDPKAAFVGYAPVLYRWRHTSTDGRGTNTVYVKRSPWLADDIAALLAWWNRTPEWKYELVALGTTALFRKAKYTPTKGKAGRKQRTAGLGSVK